MIKGLFHRGSGLGNQLHRYIGTKIIAMEKGEEHTMIAPELFKGKEFIKLDIMPNDIKYTIEDGSGRVIPESYKGVIEGEFQGEEDFIRHIDKVKEWLKVEPIDMPDDLCVINFRGGEYVGARDLFLPQSYWYEAINMMEDINPDMRFEVHTDDIQTAQQFFPGMKVIKNVSINWRSIRYAKYLILSNSSFAIFPALLGDAHKIIAPMYWAGYNVKEWRLPQNQYKKFTYI